MSDPVSIPPLPAPLVWGVEPASFSLDDGPLLTITAPPRSDLFVDPAGSDPQDATTNLQAVADTHQADARTAIDTATSDYDTKTAHGASQSAVGGVDVQLACPSTP